jgi:hypothetical protein
MQRYVRTWGTSRHGADIVSVPPQPRQPRLTAATAQRLRQLGDVGFDPPGLVASEEVRRRAASRLLLEIDVGGRLRVAVADDEASPI